MPISHVAYFAWSLFAYVVLDLSGPLLVRGERHLPEGVHTVYTLSDDLQLTPRSNHLLRRCYVLLFHPPTPVYSFVFTPGLYRIERRLI